MGATFIASATDIIVLKEGLKSIQKQYSELGFTFDSRLGDGVKAL